MLPRRASRGAPLRSIRFFLEMGAGEELLRQILRIVYDRADDQQDLAVRLRDFVEILREYGIGAVRNSVLAQISGLHMGCHHMQRAWPHRLGTSLRRFGSARKSGAAARKTKHAAAAPAQS